MFRQETAVHGVHNLLSAEIQKPQGEGLAVQRGGPLRHLHPVGGQGIFLKMVVDNPVDKGALPRRAVAQKNHLALVDSFLHVVSIVRLNQFPRLCEQGNVSLVQRDARQVDAIIDRKITVYHKAQAQFYHAVGDFFQVTAAQIQRSELGQLPDTVGDFANLRIA